MQQNAPPNSTFAVTKLETLETSLRLRLEEQEGNVAALDHRGPLDARPTSSTIRRIDSSPDRRQQQETAMKQAAPNESLKRSHILRKPGKCG